MKTTIEKRFFYFIGLGIVVLFFNQCSVIKPGYNGVLNRPLGDGIKVDKVYEDGFSWRAPLTRMLKFNVQYKSYQENIDILTSDELHTTIAVSAILRPEPEELPYLVLEIGENYYNSVVKPELFSVTRSVMAQYEYSLLSAKSTEIEQKILENLKSRLAGKHVELNHVTLDHIIYSKAVTSATDRKLSTKQEIEQKNYEMQIAEKEAEIQRIKARGQKDAQQIIDQGLTQKYLQFKSLEVQERLSESVNAKFFFIPLGKDGLPVIIDADGD